MRQELAPTLCVTAAYGNFLPAAFLETPTHGTLNIHPSLLPRWRGAAPVQRTLEAGDAETGVSLAYTVLAMVRAAPRFSGHLVRSLSPQDSGPLLAQERVVVAADAQHNTLLADLFARGAKLLLASLPAALDGSAAATAVPQSLSGVLSAPKVRADEGWLDWTQGAAVLHNRVRAFHSWPGARACFTLGGGDGEPTPVTLKVLSSRLGQPAERGSDVVTLNQAALRVPCADGSSLELLSVQVAGGRPMSGAAYWAGLRGRALCAVPPPPPPLAAAS